MKEPKKVSSRVFWCHGPVIFLHIQMVPVVLVHAGVGADRINSKMEVPENGIYTALVDFVFPKCKKYVL